MDLFRSVLFIFTLGGKILFLCLGEQEEWLLGLVHKNAIMQ